MSVKLFSNSIPTGKEKKFSDLVDSYVQTKTADSAPKMQKTASIKVAEEVKVAENEEAESSGQLDVEPLHQKGESTPKVGKDKEKESSASGKMKKEDKEGEDSKQPEWEGKKENNNDPESGKHRAGDGDQKKASKSTKFVKIANLDDKTKSFLRKYWESLYPKEYVDAMIADK